MGVLVAGAGVNPADQRWGFWPLLPPSVQLPTTYVDLVCPFTALAKWASAPPQPIDLMHSISPAPPVVSSVDSPEESGRQVVSPMEASS